MPRMTTAAPGAAATLGPVLLPDHAVYFPDDARKLLRLRSSTFRREIREGRLRVSKRAGKYFFLGKWLVEWIEGGELRRQVQAFAQTHSHN